MNQLIRDYIAELKGSPFKSGAVAILLATGLLLWGRLLLKEVPRTASAWQAASAVAENDTTNTRSNTRSDGGVALAPPPPLTRDLFELDPSRYRRTQLEKESPTGEKLGELSPEDSIREAVVSAARELTVHSVVEGEEPIVFINRKVLRAGDIIEGFTVLKIEPRSVILEREGIRVRLGL